MVQRSDAHHTYQAHEHSSVSLSRPVLRCIGPRLSRPWHADGTVPRERAARSYLGQIDMPYLVGLLLRT